MRWTTVSGASTHRVQRGTSRTDESTFETVDEFVPQDPEGLSGSTSTTKLKYYSAPCNQTYYFRVAAYGNGTSYDRHWSEYSSVVTAPDCPPPPAPSGVTVTRTAAAEPPDDPSEVEVSWNAFPSAARYRVGRRTEGNTYYTIVKTITEDGNGNLATSVTLDAPCGTDTFLLRVASYGDGENYGADWGEPSTGVAAPTCPSTPTGVSVTRSTTEGPTVVDVNWTNVGGAPIARVQRGHPGPTRRPSRPRPGIHRKVTRGPPGRPRRSTTRRRATRRTISDSPCAAPATIIGANIRPRRLPPTARLHQLRAVSPSRGPRAPNRPTIRRRSR